MIFFITYYLLEVIFGTGYWIIEKSAKGVYYLVTSNKKQIEDSKQITNKKINNSTQLINPYEDTIVISRKDYNYEKKKILDKIEKQNTEIILLNYKLDELTKKFN